MPRQKTGNPLGRPQKYSENERPVTVSLRIPHDLAAQMKRYASIHRQSVTELLLDGLKERIGEGDPRGLGTPVLQTAIQGDNEYYDNTEISTVVLEEIRTALARQATQLQALTQALEQRPTVSPPGAYYGNTTKVPTEQHSTPEPVREGHGGQAPRDTHAANGNTVLQEERRAALVARLHQMRANGLSLSQIAGQLQAEGLPTLSGKGQWQKGTVDKLLHKQAQRQAQPA